MTHKTKTTVKIGGREYTMRGFESEEYIHKVAIFLDRKMQEVEKAQPSLSNSMITVLTAVNLADEILKLKDEVDKLQQEIRSLKDTNKKPVNSSIVYEMNRKGRR